MKKLALIFALLGLVAVPAWAITASADNTQLWTNSLTDAQGNVFAIMPASGGKVGAQIIKNGFVDPSTENIKVIFAWKGAVYYQDTGNAFWGDTTGAWVKLPADPRVATAAPTPTPTPTPTPAPTPTPVTSGPTPPPQAVAAGYTHLAFGAKPPTVCPTPSGTCDFYPYNGFDGTNQPQPSQWTVNADGSLTFLTESSYNGLVTLNSHSPAVSTPGALATNTGSGLVFKYGYFEATLKFDPTLLGKNPGWPSFWGAMVNGYTSAPYAETDFMEAYANSSWPGVGKANLIQTLHQWLDGSGDQFSNANNTVPNQSSIDLTQPHTYGCLWTPTTYSCFIDNKPTISNSTVSPVSTQIASNSGKTSATGSSTFTVMNGGGAVYLQLGTGVSFPVTFSGIHVWQ